MSDPTMSNDRPGIDTPARREKLDRLSRQLRIDQTARAIYVATMTSPHMRDTTNGFLHGLRLRPEPAETCAEASYYHAEILEAERERRKKDTETS